MLYQDYQEYFEPLKHHGIPPSHPLYDIAFYLLCASITQEQKGTAEDLAPVLDVWGSLERPNIWVFHGPYVVPEFWERHFRNPAVKEHFSKYFETWIERANNLTWSDYALDLRTYFTHVFPKLTELQFNTLLAILKSQTDSIKELKTILHRSEEAISRDKKHLYQIKAIHKSVWIHFPKLGLIQKTLILFHQFKKGYRALVSPSSPWIYSQTSAYLLNRYSILTFLVPDLPRADQLLDDLREQFINTSDVNDALLFQPDLSEKRPLVTINYSTYDPKNQKWKFDVGFPYSATRLREPSDQAIYLRPRRQPVSDAPPTPKYSTNLMKTLDIVYQKGWQSIRQLQNALGTSFHKARQILQTITNHGLCYERFVSTLGSTLSTLLVILHSTDEATLSQLTSFFTYLPEQYTTWIKGDVRGMYSYIRVPHEYQQETIQAIEALANPYHLIVVPLIGARDIHWHFPWKRWDEENQTWQIKSEDFALIDLL